MGQLLDGLRQILTDISPRLAVRLPRRAFLRGMGLVGTGLWTLSGCTSVGEWLRPANNEADTLLPRATAAQAQERSTLRVAFLNSPRIMDPARMNSLEAYQVAYALYDALTYVDENLEPQPLVATGWESSPDGLTWTIPLKQGVKFHNGADLTARDVVYTFQRLLDPALGSPLRTIFAFIQDIEAIDDYTVRFVLASRNEDLPALLGGPRVGIVPAGMTTAELDALPVGCGPWRINRLTPGEEISFVHFADYHDTEVPVMFEGLDYVYYPSLAAQTDALLSGEADLLPDVDPARLAALAEQPNIDIIEVTSGRYQALVMNVAEPPFDDLRVRQALKACVDRPRIQAEVYQGFGLLANDQPIAPFSPFWADLPLGAYDPARARELLAQAGYPDGLQLTLLTAATSPGMVELAQAFRELARPAGIEIQVVQVPADVYGAEYADHVPFHVDNRSFRPTADETLMVAYHSQSFDNSSHWSTPTVDGWIEAARRETDFEKRRTIYQEIQRVIQEEGATIIPLFRPVLMAKSRAVVGFNQNPTGYLDFAGIELMRE